MGTTHQYKVVWSKDKNGDKLSFDPSDTCTKSAVYIFCITKLKDGKEYPFYVGQTNNYQRRMNEYKRGAYSAPTDFRLHHAILHFCSRQGLSVSCHIHEPERDGKKRLKEEHKQITEALKKGYQLLNSFPNYLCEKDPNPEKQKIKRGIDAEIQKDSVGEVCKALLEKYMK